MGLWPIYLGKFHHDLTVLPHWTHGFYRGIIPTWPNNSGWWIIVICPDTKSWSFHDDWMMQWGYPHDSPWLMNPPHVLCSTAWGGTTETTGCGMYAQAMNCWFCGSSGSNIYQCFITNKNTSCFKLQTTNILYTITMIYVYQCCYSMFQTSTH